MRVCFSTHPAAMAPKNRAAWAANALFPSLASAAIWYGALHGSQKIAARKVLLEDPALWRLPAASDDGAGTLRG